MAFRHDRRLFRLASGGWMTLLALLGMAWANETPTAADLQQALTDLSHPDFAAREAATRQLWQHADRVEAQLQAALTSKDPEVKIRAHRINEAVRMGIRPDTPRAVVEKIYAFHDGNLQEKRNIIGELVSAGNLNTALRLLRALENPTIQAQLSSILATEVRTQVLRPLLNGAWDDAETLLRNAALGDLGMRDYASFLAHTGRLEAALERLRASPSPDLHLHTWLLRAAGKFDEARELAKDAPELVHEIGAAKGEALAFCEAELGQPTINEFIRPAIVAAKARLNHDAAAFDKAIEALIELAQNENITYAQRFAISALLLNDAVEAVLSELPDLEPEIAYDIQSYRGLYADALKRWELEEERPPYDAWLEERCERIAQNQDPQNENLQQILGLAGHLHDMGEEEEAVRMLSEASVAAKNNLKQRRTLTTEAIRLKMRPFAESQLKELNASGARIDQLRGIIPFSQDLLAQWQTFFDQTSQAPTDRINVLIQAWQLLDAPEETAVTGPSEETLQILTKARETARTLPQGQRASYLENVYLTAAVNHADELALDCLQELAPLTNTAEHWQRLGNAYMEEASWDRAKEAHLKAWEAHRKVVEEAAPPNDENALAQAASNTEASDTLEPTYLYLAGLAHQRAGDDALGKQMMDQSRLLCLGNLKARFALASVMDRYGEEAQAIEEWTLIAHLSQSHEAEGTWSFYHLAQHAGDTDPVKAIAYLERVIVARHRLGVRAEAEFTFNLRLRSLAHQWQAKASLDEGEEEAALDALDRYWKLTPGNASIGEQLLPWIEAAGHADVAKDYYDKARTLALEACRVFPQSAMVHNNLAWLDARSRRHLQEALKHAHRALELKPDTAAYLDTLAEVHFALGDREKALELSGQAVKLTPLDKELLGQRDRFENAPLPEKRAEGE